MKNRREFSLESFKQLDLLPLLAYETGVHLGDGHLCYNYNKHDRKMRYILQYTGDIVNEYDFYQTVLNPTLNKLYDLDNKIGLHKYDNTCILKTKKESICSFKKEIGLPVGRKVDVIIPKFINTKELKLNFLRGFVDTDFSLTFKPLKKIDYPTLSTKISDKILLKQLIKICFELGLKPYSLFDVVDENPRYLKGYSTTHHLYLHGKKNLEIWMNKVGFWSSKHLTKYLIWKALGKVPKGSTTEQRYKILKSLNIEVPVCPGSLAS